MLVVVLIWAIVALIVKYAICTLSHSFESEKEASEYHMPSPFVASEYLDRIEKTGLESLESKKPIEKVIILWWGLDGLRLSEDGTLEWVSRKKPEPANQNVFFQPQQSIFPYTIPYMIPPDYGPFYVGGAMCQSMQTQIDYLESQNICLRIQAAQMEQNAKIIKNLNLYSVGRDINGNIIRF